MVDQFLQCVRLQITRFKTNIIMRGATLFKEGVDISSDPLFQEFQLLTVLFKPTSEK